MTSNFSALERVYLSDQQSLGIIFCVYHQSFVTQRIDQYFVAKATPSRKRVRARAQRSGVRLLIRSFTAESRMAPLLRGDDNFYAN